MISPTPREGSFYPAAGFDREDTSDDCLSYISPRKVVHIDAEAIGAADRLQGEVRGLEEWPRIDTMGT